MEFHPPQQRKIMKTELELQKEFKIKIVNMSRRFGTNPCVLAGFENCSGDCIIYMDSDLQDPPELITEIIKQHEESQPEQSNIAEKIEEVMEPERTRPDFTEVLEPEVAVEPKKDTIGMIGVRTVENKSGKVVTPPKPEMTDEERAGMLNKFHQEHGKFEDISEDEIKAERDEANRLQFLEDVGITEEEARNHPPLTESRKAFFQDHIDDIKRGDTTSENLPPELAKTIAVLMLSLIHI